MSDAIVVALITGGISLLGSVLTIISSTRRQAVEMDKKLAVFEAKMDDMKDDIKSHNQYAKMFADNIPAINQHMKDVDRRLSDLERRTTA